MSTQEHMLRYDSVQQSKLLVALKHNKRELQAERGFSKNIDFCKTHLNYFLFSVGTADFTYNWAKSQLALAGVHKIRKNGVLAIECIFSLPAEWLSRDCKPFFDDCLAWVRDNFEGVLLGFDVHLDESCPHAHALVLPLLDGKLQGDRIKGGKKHIAIRQKSFYEGVSSKYGFQSPMGKKLSPTAKTLLAKRVMRALEDDPASQSKVFAWIRDNVFANPFGCAEILGITLQEDRAKIKHFVDYKRSRGRGTFQK